MSERLWRWDAVDGWVDGVDPWKKEAALSGDKGCNFRYAEQRPINPPYRKPFPTKLVARFEGAFWREGPR